MVFRTGKCVLFIKVSSFQGLPIRGSHCITHVHFILNTKARFTSWAIFISLPLTSLLTMAARSSSCSALWRNVSPITVATNLPAIARRRSARKAWITNIWWSTFPTAPAKTVHLYTVEWRLPVMKTYWYEGSQSKCGVHIDGMHSEKGSLIVRGTCRFHSRHRTITWLSHDSPTYWGPWQSPSTLEQTALGCYTRPKLWNPADQNRWASIQVKKRYYQLHAQ